MATHGDRAAQICVQENTIKSPLKARRLLPKPIDGPNTHYHIHLSMSAFAKQVASKTHQEAKDESGRQVRFASDKAVAKRHSWAVRKFAAMFRILAK
jgi:hypothetical protein